MIRTISSNPEGHYHLVKVGISKSKRHLIKALFLHPGSFEGPHTPTWVFCPPSDHFTIINVVGVSHVVVESSLDEEEARLVNITSPDGRLAHSVNLPPHVLKGKDSAIRKHLLSSNNIQISRTPNLLPDVGEGMVTKQPNLLAVLDRGLPVLERRQVLERTIHPDAEECRFVR